MKDFTGMEPSRMETGGYYQFSYLPLTDTPLKREFGSVVAAREGVVTRDPSPSSAIDRQFVFEHLFVMYTEAGEAVAEAGGQRTPVRTDSIFVQPYGSTYTDRATKLPWRVRYLCMNGPLVDEFQMQFLRGEGLWTHLYDAPPARWRQLIVELVELTFEQPSGWPWRFLSRLTELFDAFLSNPPPARIHADLLSRVQRLLESQTTNPWHLPDVCVALHMDPTTLTRRFKQLVGQSPAVWIRRQRMQLALKFLHQGMTVVRVADQLGFGDPSCFSRQFKAVMRMPPAQARRSPPHLR